LIVLIGPPGAGKTTAGKLIARKLDVAFRDTDADVEAAAGKPVADVFVEDGEEAFRDLERQATLKALAEHSGVLAVGSGAILDADVRAALAALAAAPAPSVPNAAAPAPSVPNAAAPAPSVPNAAAPAPSVPNAAAPAPSVPNAAAPAPSVPNAQSSPLERAESAIDPLAGAGGGGGGGAVVYLKADFGAVARHAGLDRPRVVLPGNPRGRLRALLEERGPLYESVATIIVDTADADAEELADRIAAELPR
jgi:shikimate kinase